MNTVQDKTETQYKQLLKGYPKHMSMEQMRIVCHISKRTARLLLQKGLVPCKNTGKKTHTYRITKAAVINYLMRRDAMPEKYILLGSDKMRKKPPAMSTTDDSLNEPIEPLTFEKYPDVLSIQQAAILSGVSTATVKLWVKNNYLMAFIKNRACRIPKLSLIEYLDSPQHKGMETE